MQGLDKESPCLPLNMMAKRQKATNSAYNGVNKVIEIAKYGSHNEVRIKGRFLGFWGKKL